mmetsp:Transcript_61047/g.69884  ORF Transcript_61047/g.69884 Transcript_61047/m.69884 type:complete len:165 (-) Transcript_61047:829-1323(-)
MKNMFKSMLYFRCEREKEDLSLSLAGELGDFGEFEPSPNERCVSSISTSVDIFRIVSFGRLVALGTKRVFDDLRRGESDSSSIVKSLREFLRRGRVWSVLEVSQSSFASEILRLLIELRREMGISSSNISDEERDFSKMGITGDWPSCFLSLWSRRRHTKDVIK